MRRALLAIAITAVVGCGGAEPPRATIAPAPAAPAIDAAVDAAPPVDAAPAIDAAVPAAAAEPEVWLRGALHVHARPSGDSSTPIADVMAWYHGHGYDFIALTDHNRISELAPGRDTHGRIAITDPDAPLIVLAGMELTHNPHGCVPQRHPTGRCRIHVNLIAPTGRTDGKLAWAALSTHDRLAKYDAAIAVARRVGGLVQLNHPNWYWGMTADLLVELARRGAVLYEVANAQFRTWDAGDAAHPSTEALWDAALARGAKLWAVASDDAHDYDPAGRGTYPAGGGWVVVKARRDPRAILDAIAAGRFYASTGVVLERAEVERGELVIVVAPGAGPHEIRFVENGTTIERVTGLAARRRLPAHGYLRAVVTRGDGARAWTQPVRP